VSTTTFMAKKGQVSQNWHLIDATDQVVGRLAVQIATILRGKHRPEYTPHVDTGEYVIVINAEKVRFTGKKWDTVTYKSYSHYPGGLKVTTARETLAKRPADVIINAVRRMMPRNRLGRAQMTKLKVYAGDKHPHQAQMPIEYKLS
jgi:large subunit ribosomal protein L13